VGIEQTPSRKITGSPVVRAFLSAPSGVISLVAIALLLACAILAPILLDGPATNQDLAQSDQGPSISHPLGTDGLGRDILARVLVASRLSLGLALAAGCIAVTLGIASGVLAATRGPRLRPFALRGIDMMLAFPGLLTAIFVSTIIGVGAGGAILGVGIALSFSTARVASTLTMSVSGRDYIASARVLGVRASRRMLRYVLPNIAEPLIVSATTVTAFSMIVISALSFLGIGVQEPDFDWGRMLTQGLETIYTNPASALGPALAIALSAMVLGFFGEAVARAMNPLLWTGGRRGRGAMTGGASNLAPGGDGAPRASREVMDATDSVATPVLAIRDLRVSFPGADGPTEIVKGVSFSLKRGDIVGIVGESGSGKTMTAMAIAQLIPYPGEVKGSVTLHGEELTALSEQRLDRVLGTELAVVFQDPTSSFNPALTIGRQLTEAAIVHGGDSKVEAKQKAVARLTEMNIPAAERQLKRYPHEFSGGMRQRAMIAMGLMNEPSVLIADEPTTALDVTVQAQIMDLLNEVNHSHHTAVLLISHNLALISQNCTRILVMYAGRIVEDLTAEQLRRDPQHPYTRALVGAVPELGHARETQLEYIPGETPEITAPPSGCPFHPRCPLAIERCKVERPPLLARPGEGGRRVACHVANDGVAVAPGQAVSG
jgi:peptide/nickel transport system permease protein